MDTERKYENDELIKICIDHFGVKHVIKNPFVIIIGITTYNKPWSTLPGVQKDVDQMRKLWKYTLQYKTVECPQDYSKYKGCTKTNIIDFLRWKCINVLNPENEDDNKQQYDGLICIVSGHGLDDSIITSDGKKIDINQDLLHPFNATKNAALEKYPKIFIFDACRGEAPPHILERRKKIKGNAANDDFSINVESGYSVSYATSKGKPVPARDSGGVFIQPFYDVMMHLYHERKLDKVDFASILKMVSQKATIKVNDRICPVHEDYTMYKIFIKGNNEDDHDEDIKTDTNSDGIRQLPLDHYWEKKSILIGKRNEISDIVGEIDNIVTDERFKYLLKRYQHRSKTFVGLMFEENTVINHEAYPQFKNDYVDEMKERELGYIKEIVKLYKQYYVDLKEELNGYYEPERKLNEKQTYREYLLRTMETMYKYIKMMMKKNKKQIIGAMGLFVAVMIMLYCLWRYKNK